MTGFVPTAVNSVGRATPASAACPPPTLRGSPSSRTAGWAEYGYCASHSRYFWGLRLHLVATLHGLPIGYALTGAKADERQVLLDLLHDDPMLAGTRPGQILIGDKNYYGRDFEADLANPGIQLLRRARKGEAERPLAGSSSPCGRSLSRSTTPSRVSSTSNGTWAARPPESSSA